jgi:hypothetical protein
MDTPSNGWESDPPPGIHSTLKRWAPSTPHSRALRGRAEPLVRILIAMGRAAYLFDPAQFAQTLASLSNLGNAVGDVASEGSPSQAYAGMRKSERQLHRVLANTHYEHLRALLQSLNYCIEHGFVPPRLLSTRDRGQFQSALSELRVAEHLLLREFEVSGLDELKGSEPVPELVATRNGVHVAVEVYRPVEWEGLTALDAELRDKLKNLDAAFDFSLVLRIDWLRESTTPPHPAELAAALDTATRDQIVDSLVHWLNSRLAAGYTQGGFAVARDELNLQAAIELRHAGPSRSTRPDRVIAEGGPTLSGYAPDAMFDRLVRGRVVKKLSAGQAARPGVAEYSLLVVDLGGSEITSELFVPFYRESFGRSLERLLGSGLRGYDLVAICESGEWGKQLPWHFLIREDSVSPAVSDAIFGEPIRTSTA